MQPKGQGRGGPVPMDVSAVIEKGKGKGKGGKGKGKGTFFDGNCNKCYKYGHRARDCGEVMVDKARTWCTSCSRYGHVARDCKGKGKGKQSNQQSSGQWKQARSAATTSTAATRFEGVCFKCGTKGHRPVDCRRVLCLSDQGHSEATYVPTSAGVSTIQTVLPSLAAPWIVHLDSEALTMVERQNQTHIL
eukprot:13767975-Heterocapsa_arctica.AAC.1